MCQARVLEDVVSNWDMDGMSSHDTRRLLLLLSTIEHRREHLRGALMRRCSDDGFHVLLQATWTLLTKGRDGLARSVDGRAAGAVNNPFKWQWQHMDAIEKLARLRRPRKVRFRTTRSARHVEHGDTSSCRYVCRKGLPPEHLRGHVKIHVCRASGLGGGVRPLLTACEWVIWIMWVAGRAVRAGRRCGTTCTAWRRG